MRIFVSREERSNNKEEIEDRGEKQGSKLRKVHQMRARMDSVVPAGSLAFMMKKAQHSGSESQGYEGSGVWDP